MYIENKVIKKYVSLWLILMFWFIAIMIVVGGLTRLTDSGLSITQWQLFSGILPPLNETQWNKYFELYKKIPEYKLQNFSMDIKQMIFSILSVLALSLPSIKIINPFPFLYFSPVS